MDRPVSDLTGLLVQWPFETGPETTAGLRHGSEQTWWAGSSCMGTADNSERSVLGSMQGLGRTSGYCNGMHRRSPWEALERC